MAVWLSLDGAQTSFPIVNFRVLARLAPVLATALLVACADRPKSDSGESVPSVSAGKLTKSAVTFPAAPRDEAARAALPAQERAKIDESFVPVLVPRAAAVDVHLVVEAGFYAYAGRVEAKLADGRTSVATIAIQGNRFAHEHPDFPKDVSTHAFRGTRGLFTINEGIATATWAENGATYSVDVECSVAEDSRCHDEGFVLELTKSLAFVGGRP
jgi:hypothetical protein